MAKEAFLLLIAKENRQQEEFSISQVRKIKFGIETSFLLFVARDSQLPWQIKVIRPDTMAPPPRHVQLSNSEGKKLLWWKIFKIQG